MKRLLLPVMSESQPPISLIKDASPSRSPEISPIASPVPPKDAIRNGRSGVIISELISFTILELPSRYVFLSPFSIDLLERNWFIDLFSCGF